MSFSQQLKDLRKLNNITQDELAAMLDVKKHQITDWETQRSHPSVSILVRIADFFSVSMQELLEEPLQINPTIPFEEQKRYFKISPKTPIETKLFELVEQSNEQQLEDIKTLIHLIQNN